MKRALAARAADTYVLASAEKIGAVSRYSVLPFASVAGLITDAPANDPTMGELSRLGIALVGAG
jgi:DeoR/GlpR family transcriptional regulator of sugar metabolism